MFDVVRRIAEDAGRLLRDNFGKKHEVIHKSRIDLVTNVDLAAEQLIKTQIAEHFPRHQILAEETGLSEMSGCDPEYRWIVDPLDGTTNYAHSYPCFAVSIAIEKQSEIIFGVVYDPMRDEQFTAERGAGAWLNGKRIEVSQISDLSLALLSTGFPYDIRTSCFTNLENFASFATRAQAIRRDGAASLDLCYTACGRFDGFWELGLKPWDTAAGVVILGEAGGKITRFDGSPFTISDRQICASNGLIHDQMITVLAAAEQPPA